MSGQREQISLASNVTLECSLWNTTSTETNLRLQARSACLGGVDDRHSKQSGCETCFDGEGRGDVGHSSPA